MALGGYYRVEGLGAWPSVVTWVTLGIVPAFFEEILMRGIIFRITEESLGTWLALVISGLLFGLAHLANPNATVVAALAIALEAGVLLAAGYIVTASALGVDRDALRVEFRAGRHFRCGRIGDRSSWAA